MRYEIVKPIDEKAITDYLDTDPAGCFFAYLRIKGYIREVSEFKVGQWFEGVCDPAVKYVIVAIHQDHEIHFQLVSFSKDGFCNKTKQSETISELLSNTLLTPIPPPVFGEEASVDKLQYQHWNVGDLLDFLAENFRLIRREK